MTPCTNCNQAEAKVTGLCHACYNYRYVYGRDRPARLFQRKKRQRRYCRNCHEPRGDRKFIKGRCPTCYRYWRRHGRDRVPRIKVTHCRNCGHKRQKGEGFARGRCRNCYQYWRQHGYERPRWLWDPDYKKPAKEKEKPTIVDNNPRCDCGQPATHRITVPYGLKGHLKMVLDLCDECHRLEQEMQAELQARGVELVAA